jgi:hypothetical protein
MLFAIGFILSGLVIIGYILFLATLYTFTDAKYLKQTTVRSSISRHELEAEVSFTTPNGKAVTTHINPSPNHLRHGASIPIYYENSNPKNAFYSTPDDSIAIPIFLAVGGSLLLAGISFFVSAIRWRRRILAAASQTGKWQAVYLYHWESIRMVAVFLEGGGPRYSWLVSSRNLPSKKPQSSSDANETTEMKQTKRRAWPTVLFSRFRQSTISAVPWPEPSMAEVSGDVRAYRWLIIRSSNGLMLPISRACPVIGTAHAATAPLVIDDALVSAHRRLLASYVRVRAQAKLLPWFTFVSLRATN